MRILYIVHQFFPKHYTGTERLTLDLARQMSRMGHQPNVMTFESDAEGEQGFTPFHKDILIKRYSYESVPVISLARSHTKFRRSLAYASRLLSDTKKNRVYNLFDSSIEEAFNKLDLKLDLVHVCHPMRLSSVAKACKQLSIPIVLTVTDPWLLCPRSLVDVRRELCDGPKKGEKCVTNCNFHRKIIERYYDALSIFNMADEITTSSKFTAFLFRRNGWKCPIRLVTHSVDYSYVKRSVKNIMEQDACTVTFGYIGGIVWHKGVHVLVNAFRKVKSSKLRLDIYGSIHDDPEYADAIVQLAKDDARIQFKGSFDMINSCNVMGDLSVLVVPSVYYDNFPLVVLLGLAYKVPVIGSDIGGIPESVQDGRNGFLVKPGRSDELALLIARIAEKPEILQELRKNIVSPRPIEEEALDYESIYSKLTTKVGSAGK